MGSILAQSPAIGGLAGQIANNAYLLEQSIGLEGPFLGDQVAIHTAASGDEAIQRARLEIIDQCRSLLSLVAGPSEMLKNMVLIVSNTVRRTPSLHPNKCIRTSTTSSRCKSSIISILRTRFPLMAASPNANSHRHVSCPKTSSRGCCARQ